jgi:hypothetical protein
MCSVDFLRFSCRASLPTVEAETDNSSASSRLDFDGKAATNDSMSMRNSLALTTKVGDLFFRFFFKPYQLVPRIRGRTDQLIKLLLDSVRIPRLGVLDKKAQEKGDDRGRVIYSHAPARGPAEQRARSCPDQHERKHDGERRRFPALPRRPEGNAGEEIGHARLFTSSWRLRR